MRALKTLVPLVALVLILNIAGCDLFVGEPLSLLTGKYQNVDLLDWSHYATWSAGEPLVAVTPPELLANFNISAGQSVGPFFGGFSMHSLNVKIEVDGKEFNIPATDFDDIALPEELFAEIEARFEGVKLGIRHFPAEFPPTAEKGSDVALWLAQYKDGVLIANLMVVFMWPDPLLDEYGNMNIPKFLAVMELVEGELMVSLPIMAIDGVVIGGP